MNPVVDHLGAVDAVLLLEVGVEAGLDIVENRLPSIARVIRGQQVVLSSQFGGAKGEGKGLGRYKLTHPRC